MNFKNLKLLFVIIVIGGCSEFINGEKKKEEILKISSDRFACLNQVPEALRSLVAENSNTDQVAGSLACLENSLAYFKKRTKGTVPDGYSVQDIRSFFGNYLGDQDRVSDEMALQLMKVKQALFGGSIQVIAKSELQSLIDLITGIRLEITKLKPHWEIILLKKDFKFNHEAIETGNNALKDSLTRLVLNTHLVRTDYSFSDFKSLVTEIEKFIKRSPGSSSVNLIKWFPLVESVKIHLFSDDADMSSIAKWTDSIGMVMELHRIAALFKYQFKDLDFYSQDAFNTLDKMALSALRLLDRSWWMVKDGIPFSKTEDLFKLLEKENFFPTKLKAHAVYSAYTNFVKSFLNREVDNQSINLKTLSRKHVWTLKSEYRIFKAVQNFNGSLRAPFSYQDIVKELDNRPTVQVEEFPEISEEHLALGWRDWNIHLKQFHPLSYVSNGGLLLDRDAKSSPEWSWSALSRLNIMRLFNRVLMMSFGDKRTLDLSKETLSEVSFTRYYADYWDFGVQLEAFDDRNGNSGKRTFFEANHFVYSGNGSPSVTIQESFELINIIFSAGLSGLERIQNDVKNTNCSVEEVDYFGKRLIDEKCFGKLLRQNFGSYFGNITGMAKWVRTLSDADWELFYKEILSFSKGDKHPGRIETGDLRTMVVISHYIESMYIRIDTNKDDKLSVSELIDGSSRFLPFFKDLFKLKPKGPFFEETQQYLIDYAIERAFACMVITGKMPAVTTCTPAFFNDAFISKPYSNRTLILKTLNSFKSSIK